MTLYLALLRGVNVGGRNRVPMKDLKTALHEAGFNSATTYLQSGNVIFEWAGADRDTVATELQGLIRERFGTETPVVIRTTEQLMHIPDHNPFLSDEDDFTRLHIMFLNQEPNAMAVESLDDQRSPGDRFTVHRAEIYLHLPNGAGRSKLTIDYFERRLGVTATGRNWKTVMALHQMMMDRATG